MNAKPTGPGGLRPYQLQQVLDAIEARIAEPIQVAELAQVAHLSPFHFSRMFKKSTGLAPHAYITSRRMERARELLAGSEVPLGEVATRVGYQTQAHFTDVFRKQCGKTPGCYRREAGQPQRARARDMAEDGAHARAGVTTSPAD